MNPIEPDQGLLVAAEKYTGTNVHDRNAHISNYRYWCSKGDVERSARSAANLRKVLLTNLEGAKTF